MTMKIFDWKRRDADESELTDIDRPWTLTTLKPAPGSVHRKKRKGRGIAAGQGASCGFGMRGQKSRSGRPTRAGFEGGQNPLYRRLPKFVGKPMGPGHKRKVSVVLCCVLWCGVVLCCVVRVKIYILGGFGDPGILPVAY